MVADIETRRFKYLFVTALVFAGSAFASCREIKYVIWGRTAAAEITRVRKASVYSRFGSKQVRAVRYRWTDEDDGQREDVVNRSLDWRQPADGILRIQYLPSVRESRLQGERNYIAPTIFVAITGLMLFFVVKTWRAAYR